MDPIYRERAALFNIAVTDTITGLPINLSGNTLRFTAVLPRGDTVFEKTTTNSGIMITNALGGLATLMISPSDTASLPAKPGVSLRFELVLTIGSSPSYQLNAGVFDVLPIEEV